jgi:hypothetical protein
MQKVHELWFFWNYGIIFLKINLWNLSMGLWTGSMAISSRVYGSLIKRGPFNPRRTHESRTRRGTFSWPSKSHWTATI